MDSSSSHAIGAARDVTPPGSRRSRRRRRPTGEPPPLPRHLESTGVGWMVAALGLVILTLLVFMAGRYGRGVSFAVADNRVVEALANLRTPGLTSLMRGLNGLLGSLWTVKVLAWATLIVLVVYKRFRHLVIALISFQVLSLAVVGLSAAARRPRPFGVELEGSWAGWAMPSRPVAFLSAVLISMLYSLVPKGRWRQAGKWVATGLVTVLALARMYLGLDAPSDVLVGAALGVTIPLLAYRWFAPYEVFPISYRRGRTAHLDVGGARGQAIRRALADQLGLEIEEVKPFGLSGSAGSTPLRIKVAGDPPTVLFGKLYARSHLRSDRWYKLGRELLYGRLEDEKPFHTVRRLVQQEDYALHKLHLAGLPTPRPYGFVELTPDREYLLVSEFFDGSVELGEAEVDQGVIDDGLGIIRKLWDAGLAHRDIKPANLLVRDGPHDADRRRLRRVPAQPLAPGRGPGQHDALPGPAQRPPAGLRAGPAAVLGRGDHRGVRGHPRAGHALPAPPHAAGPGPRRARRVPGPAAPAAGAHLQPALQPAAVRARPDGPAGGGGRRARVREPGRCRPTGPAPRCTPATSAATTRRRCG